MNDHMLVCVALIGFAFGSFASKMRPVGGKPSRDWHELPSGWSRSLDENSVGYAARIDDQCHWWIARHGRTVIEGPSQTLESAKLEVDQSYSEFLQIRRNVQEDNKSTRKTKTDCRS